MKFNVDIYQKYVVNVKNVRPGQTQAIVETGVVRIFILTLAAPTAQGAFDAATKWIEETKLEDSRVGNIYRDIQEVNLIVEEIPVEDPQSSRVVINNQVTN